MNKYKKVIYILLLLTVVAGCKKESFVKENTDPNILPVIEPEKEFTNAILQIHNQSFEAYYDYYRRIMPWMQMDVNQTGNSKTLVTDVGNFNQRYGIFYPTLGAQLADLQYLISTKPDAEKAKYVYMSNIADILKIYYAFYVSDINGSMPYTEAFKGRYNGTSTPIYQTQQDLFALWDANLKAITTILKTAQPVTQVSLDANDLYFKGSAVNWVRAANALRLRIAMRLSKRDEATAKTIFSDVLSDAEQMQGNDDSWVFLTATNAVNGGIATTGSNWDVQTLRAPRPTVNFMVSNSDPRIRDFYEKNNYTQVNIDTAIAHGVYPTGTVASPLQYVGAPISPDSAQGKYKSWFTVKTIPNTTPALVLDTISYLKQRLWNPDFNSGKGVAAMPVITYADYCFMRAEIAAKGYVAAGGTAEEWYYKGVEESVVFFDAAARIAGVQDYIPVTPAEVAAYENAPDVKFSAAKALEQIAIQSYLNFYKQPNEAWALYKRTGMPNSSTALKNEDIVIDGVVKAIPRRGALSLPASTDPNYANKQAALDEMAKDAGFGNGPTDVFGRVWWDKP